MNCGPDVALKCPSDTHYSKALGYLSVRLLPLTGVSLSHATASSPVAAVCKAVFLCGGLRSLQRVRIAAATLQVVQQTAKVSLRQLFAQQTNQCCTL